VVGEGREQVIADPAGRLVWLSPALPGSVHDLTAARTHNLVHALSKAAVATFADKGYQGAGGAVGTPTKGRDLPEGIRAVNTAHAKIRAVGERANATLNWRLLRKVRCCPHRVTALTAAILTLETQPR